MTIMEQLAIVANEAHAEMQLVILYICVAAICALLAWAALWAIAKYMTPVVSWMKTNKLQFMFLAPGILASIAYGSTKPEPGPGTNTLQRIALSNITQTPAYIEMTWTAAQGYDLTGKTVRIQASDDLGDGMWSEWHDIEVIENCSVNGLRKDGFYLRENRKIRVLVEDYR